MRLSTAIRGVAWGIVAVGVAAPIARRRLRLRPPAVAGLAAAAPFALCVAVPRTPRRDIAVCALQMWAYLSLYEMPNDDPEALVRRVRVRYPVVIDRALGLGELPGVRLQHAFARAGGLRRLDAVLVGSHWAWFLVPHAALLHILTAHHRRFERSAVLVYAVFDIGVLVYWALPTAPPWYASRQGVIVAEPPLRRLMVEMGEAVWHERWERLYSLLAGNPLAAMPSLHFATSVMAAFVLAEAGPLEGAIGWTYALTLGFALVYLGEHYVIDLIAGLALVAGVRRLEKPATPVLRAIGRTVHTLRMRAAG